MNIDEALVRPGPYFARRYLEELQVAETVASAGSRCRDTPERRAAVLSIAGRKSISVANVYGPYRKIGFERNRGFEFGGA